MAQNKKKDGKVNIIRPSHRRRPAARGRGDESLPVIRSPPRHLAARIIGHVLGKVKPGADAPVRVAPVDVHLTPTGSWRSAGSFNSRGTSVCNWEALA